MLHQVQLPVAMLFLIFHQIDAFSLECNRTHLVQQFQIRRPALYSFNLCDQTTSTEFGPGNVCKMSDWVDPQDWERFKNAIRALYLTNGHKLEGPSGVIKLMEERHDFKAT
jgi:hypothetical protein